MFCLVGALALEDAKYFEYHLGPKHGGKNGGSFAFSLRGGGEKNGEIKTKNGSAIRRQPPNGAGQVCFV